MIVCCVAVETSAVLGGRSQRRPKRHRVRVLQNRFVHGGRGLAAAGTSLAKSHKYAKPRNAAVFREARRLPSSDYEDLLISKWSRNSSPWPVGAPRLRSPRAGSWDRLPRRRIRYISVARTFSAAARALKKASRTEERLSSPSLLELIGGPSKKRKCGYQKAVVGG